MVNPEMYQHPKDHEFRSIRPRDDRTVSHSALQVLTLPNPNSLVFIVHVRKGFSFILKESVSKRVVFMGSSQ